jgi:ribosome-associated protein
MTVATMELSAREKLKLRLCYNAIVDKKAEGVSVLDLRGYSSVTDFFVICQGSSSTQVSAISDNIEKVLRESGMKHYNVEGRENAQWILLDCDNVIVHVFQPDTRKYYALENLWVDARKVDNRDIESWEVN